MRSDVAGTVESIEVQGEEALITVVGDDGETLNYTLPEETVRIYEGDLIFVGDVLGSYFEWQVGILLQGLWLTLKVSCIAIVFGIFLGLFTNVTISLFETCLVNPYRQVR